MPFHPGKQIKRSFENGLKPVLVQGFPISIERDKDTKSVLDLTRPDEGQKAKPVIYRIFGVDVGAGETQPRIFTASFTARCAMSWCGSLPTKNRPRLFVLIEKDGVLHGEEGACGGSTYPNPTVQQKVERRRCLAAEKCDQVDDKVLKTLTPWP